LKNSKRNRCCELLGLLAIFAFFSTSQHVGNELFLAVWVRLIIKTIVVTKTVLF
jgi:hypothetical protein